MRPAAKPREKEVLVRETVTPKAAGKPIIYVSGSADSEFDLITSFIEELFGRNIHPYFWETHESDSAGFRREDPCLIITSAPSGKWKPELDEYYGIVKKAFPKVPILWLAPNSEYQPSSTNDDKIMTVLNTGDTMSPCIH